jgi:hypothetical protein
MNPLAWERPRNAIILGDFLTKWPPYLKEILWMNDFVLSVREVRLRDESE